ncbi:MAG: alpha/beta hydrolase [Rhodospirillaceae bacterium]|nr:alpha/beta hydrolase [Rhodospirillaceae bacterium]
MILSPMILRPLSYLCAAVVLSAGLAAPAIAAEPWAAPAMRGTSVDDWRGWSVLNSGKGYAASPMGQVHYRDIGPRDAKHTIVLLHQSPMSMIQFAQVQNALAEMGLRAITVDTPGYGTSDLPAKQPTIREYADNLVHVLDHVKADKVVVAGHHTGAQIATAFAANHPARVKAVILHGAAQLTAEEGDAFLSAKRTPRTPLADGSHLTRSFRAQSPDDTQAILDAKTWLAITGYIQGPDIGHYAAFTYDMLPDLMAIKAPGLILSDVKDSIHHIDLRVAKHRPDFTYVEFSKGDLLQFMAEPQRWAQVAADFVNGLE